MEYIKGSDFRLHNTVVTLGKFDGLHLGHKELIDIVLKTKGLTKVLFTFDVNPLSILSDKEFKVIETGTERINLMKDSGFDYMIDYPFTMETINTDADEFIKTIIHDKLDAKISKEYGYVLKVIEKKKMYGEVMSSTRIRSLIKKGEIRLANELLGREFSFSGEIIHGNHLGHTVGMPTINIKPEADKLLPPFGVYVSDTELDYKVYRGITNIGVKPTVGKDNAVGVETWLFGLDSDVYGHFAKVKLLDFIRPEMKFDSLEDVKRQVNIDAVKASEYTA